MLDLTGGNWIGFTIPSNGGEVLRRCLICQATFSQETKELSIHQFEEHERQMQCDLLELDGKHLTISVVERETGDDSKFGHAIQRELIGRDSDGTVYFLPFSYYDADSKGIFKCKPKSSELLALVASDD